jgi:hypothetical protein
MESLVRPSAYEEPEDHRLGMWVDEAIWGHRLYDEQTPWLTVLEFLTIFDAEQAAGRALTELGGFNTLSYQPQQQLRIRNILFNNPHLALIRQSGLRDADAWAKWLAAMLSIGFQ